MGTGHAKSSSVPVRRLSSVLTDCPGVAAHRGVRPLLGFISSGREGRAIKSRVPGAAGSVASWNLEVDELLGESRFFLATSVHSARPLAQH